MMLGACGLTSVDGYFECPGLGPQCAGNAGNAGNTSVGSGGGDMAGEGGGPGGICSTSAECGVGTCFRGECGPAFELTYLDTPTDADPQNAQWIKFQFQIKNRTASAVPLGELTLRYYYTPENVDSELQVLSVSTLPARNSDVTGQFAVTELAGSRQWTFLELGFAESAGMLGTGQSAGPIKVGIHDLDFGQGRFFQPDDYSYLDGSHLALYLRGALVTGAPPALPPAE